ncbi:MAG: hypothetical protein N3A54_02235 [Patescibacteria group bacterium]|nr:hypothetical protein [Patescibacteria group bacterium]
MATFFEDDNAPEMSIPEPDEEFNQWLEKIQKELEKEDTSPKDIITDVIVALMKETREFLTVVGQFNENEYNAAVEYMKESMELIHRKTGKYFLFLTKEGALTNFVYKKTPFFERNKRFIGQDLDMVEFSKYSAISRLISFNPSDEIDIPEEIRDRMMRLGTILKNDMKMLESIYEKIVNKVVNLDFPVAISDYFMIVSAYDLIRDIDRYKGFSVFFPNPEMPLHIENSGYKYGAIIDDHKFKEGRFMTGLDLPKAFKGTSVELMDFANEMKELNQERDYASVSAHTFLMKVLVTLALFIEDRVEHIHDLYPEGGRDEQVKKFLNSCLQYAEIIGDNVLQLLNDKKESPETLKPGDAAFIVNAETIEDDILIIDGIYVKIV